MEYKHIHPARFIDRPNRFIAIAELAGERVVCHVKNTGRCRELLVPGAVVFLEETENPNRKTKYDLIAVYKGERFINMDSQAPNRLFAEWAPNSGLFQNITLLKPEAKYGASRFDFYVEADGRKAFVEVKGVTLEENNQALFPDAPTERGVKHLKELVACHREGYDAYAVFVIQMKGVTSFSPNDMTHPAFGEALRHAQKNGVRVIAVDCHVTESGANIADFVPVAL